MKVIKYKCEVRLLVEYLEYDEKEKAYIGVDPDKSVDHGIIETLSSHSMADLIKEVERQFGTIENVGTSAEPEYRYCDDHEYHYSVPVDERIPAIDEYYFMFYQVESQAIDIFGKEIGQ